MGNISVDPDILKHFLISGGDCYGFRFQEAWTDEFFFPENLIRYTNAIELERADPFIGQSPDFPEPQLHNRVISWDTNARIEDYYIESKEWLGSSEKLVGSVQHRYGSSKFKYHNEETFRDYSNVFWGWNRQWDVRWNFKCHHWWKVWMKADEGKGGSFRVGFIWGRKRWGRAF